MRYIILLTVALFAAINTQAQKHFFDLSNLQAIDYTKRSFAIDSIIDVRENKNVLGFILTKRGKQREVLYQNASFSKNVKKCIVGAQNKTPASDYRYILRINRLFIYQVMDGGKPIGRVDLNVSFINITNRGYEHSFQAMTAASEKGKNATNWAYLLEKAIKQCMDDFEKKMSTNAILPIPITTQQLKENPCGKSSYPVHNVAKRQKALYFDLYDMRDNLGDTTTTFYPDIRENKEGEVMGATIDIPGYNELKRHLFGFSDGDNVFVKSGRHFVPLKMRNGDVIIDRYEHDNSAAIASMIIGGVTGGFIGFAIASSINPIEHIDFWIVDFDRGAISPNTQQGVKDVSAHTLIYSSTFNPAIDTLELTINQKQICQLLPNQYYNYYSSSDADSIQVCVSFNGNRSCEVIHPQLFESKIYIIRSKEEGHYELGTLKGNARKKLYQNLANGQLERVIPGE